MTADQAEGRIIEWASSGHDVVACPLDRDDPNTVAALRQALVIPRTFDIVERIELLAKSLWSDVLAANGLGSNDAARRCGEFFTILGFLHKYKPYGVKIASPFGYSLFDLNDGEGFSFQLHTEPKIEAFHFLRPKSRALVYISSRDEWFDVGETWAKAFVTGQALADPPSVRQPLAGDVVSIPEVQVVHAVLGCVLEEYASCSVDAVERLFDQNTRGSVDLPAKHLDVSELLVQCHPGNPSRRLVRTVAGWSVREWEKDEPVIDVVGELWGSRVSLPTDGWWTVPTDDLLSTIVAVDAPIDLEVEGKRSHVSHGAFACVLPGLAARVTGSGSVAVHRVSRALVQQNWSR